MRFFDQPSTARRAREAFDAAGYTLSAITERLGPHVFSHLSAGERAPLVRATRAGDRLDVLSRLFLIGGPVSLADATAALAPLSIDHWEAGGLITVGDDDVEGLLTVRPLGEPHDRLVVHDRPDASGSVRPDHVLGISASTVGLAGATIRRPIEAAFDLGTGCGVQAVHAAEHSARVVASDLNPRAVACATLTMELNGLDSVVVVREGDLLQAVGDETFDLIVANPPFVISPSERYLFRDGRRPVDELCRTIVTDAPSHLNAGGHCQLLASWAHVRGEDWRERLAAWFDHSGCDALVLEREALDPATHAASWMRQTEAPDRWDEFDAWLDYYEAHGIDAIGFGLITMRKRTDGAPWFRAEEATQDLVMPCGDHLGAIFELADLLASHDDLALRDVALRVAPDVVLDERMEPTDAGWNVVTRRLRQTTGLCHQGDVDPAVAIIVGACDGQRRLGDVLAEVASGAGIELSELSSAAMPVVRRMIEQAFLLPVLTE